MSRGPGTQRLLRAHILVAEDDEACRDHIVECLESEGATVVSASGGDLAMTEFERRRPQIILSDLWMPEGDGYAFIARVRRLSPQEGGRIPAFAMSAGENKRMALRSGFDGFIQKPIEHWRLIASMAAILSDRDEWPAD